MHHPDPARSKPGSARGAAGSKGNGAGIAWLRASLADAARQLLRDSTIEQRIALLAVISGITGVGAALSLSLPLLSFVLEHRGVSSFWIGLNTAVAGIAAIAVLPFVTRMARAIGTARLILASFAVMVVTLWLFHLVGAFWAWFPLRFVFSAAITIIFALTEFWINSLAPPAHRGLVVGIYAAFLSIGITMGPLILAITGPTGHLPFAIGVLILMIAAIPVTLVRGSEPVLTDGSNRRLWAYIKLAPMATIAALIFGAVESGGTALLPVYGIAIGFGPREAAILVAAVAVGNIVSQVPIGILSDRFNRRRMMICCAAIGAVGAAFIPIASSSFGVLVAILFVTGGIVAGLYTIGLTELGSRFTGAELADANAAFVLMYAVGMLIGPTFIGIGLQIDDPHGFAAVVAAFFVAYVLLGVIGTLRGR